MAKFIELTAEDGTKAMINIDHVQRSGIDSDTNNMMIVINDNSYCVKESYDQVKAMLEVE